jgi:hypothetical protein
MEAEFHPKISWPTLLEIFCGVCGINSNVTGYLREI